ncbi:hypothetical protein [Kiloniella antarctica]|uniref:Uncharacterized protein n=1 Tax=Kiloniella antarctica TaxID=1550907 RepID=A0ABW5BFD8_9PROT
MNLKDNKKSDSQRQSEPRSNHRGNSLASPSIRKMVKWIAAGDVFFGIIVMLVGYYKFNAGSVQWFGFTVAIIGGLLFLTIRLLEKRDVRKIN